MARRPPDSMLNGKSSGNVSAASSAMVGALNTPARAGYSGTPLAKKLGIKAASRVLLSGAPEDYMNLLEPLPAGVVFEKGESANPRVDIAHVFVTRKEDLTRQLASLRKQLRADAALWISWPKKSAKLPSTVSEDTIRELALPLGFVDVKVCAVSDVWSGLKLVVRKALRPEVAHRKDGT